jgi:CTP-dependent riboflavin kinase
MENIKETKFRVLCILCENLRNPQPQVVGIEKIAEELQQGVRETRQLLLRMNETGEIESDVEGQYSLITQTGLSLHTSMQSGLRKRISHHQSSFL